MKIIKKIEIRHFRSIHNETLERVTSFNIFAGTNDSGKSNILRALNLFFNGETSFLSKFNFNEDYSKLALLEARGKKKGRQFISIKVYFDEDEIDGKDDLKKLAKANGGLWVKREWWKFEDTFRQTQPDFIDKASQGIKRSFSILLSSIRFIYIPAFKNSDVFSHVISLVGNEEGIFIKQQAKDNLNKQIADSAGQLAQDFSSLTKINTKVSLPFTLDSFWSSLQIATEFNPALEKKINRGSAEDYLISLIARGEGVKSIFTPVVLGWLASNVKGRYWIWGIDEPENSLESSKTVHLLKKFFEYSKAAQIFVSSHSPVFLFPKHDGKNKDVSVCITVQNIEGDTKFKEIDVSDSKLKNILIKDFGVDYGTFLVSQEEYARKLSEAEINRHNMAEKLRQVSRPVVFVEGELDEKYIKKTIEIYFNSAYSADIRWIGAHDKNSGQVFFTGKSGLDQAASFIKANPEYHSKRIVLFYDVDTSIIVKKTKSLYQYKPNKESGRKFQAGIEHLLIFPKDFDVSKFFETKTTNKGDSETIVRELNKINLCDHVCKQMNIDEQKLVLSGINKILGELDSFFNEPVASVPSVDEGAQN